MALGAHSRGAHSGDTLPEVCVGTLSQVHSLGFSGSPVRKDGEERKYTKQEDRSKKGHIRSAHMHCSRALDTRTSYVHTESQEFAPTPPPDSIVTSSPVSSFHSQSLHLPPERSLASIILIYLLIFFVLE